MKVLFATSECAPFIKTGGLGDVVGSLPQTLREKDVDARVVLPLYKSNTTRASTSFSRNVCGRKRCRCTCCIALVQEHTAEIQGPDALCRSYLYRYCVA